MNQPADQARSWWANDDYRAIVLGGGLLLAGLAAFALLPADWHSELAQLTKGKFARWANPLEAFQTAAGAPKLPYLLGWLVLLGGLLGIGARHFGEGFLRFLRGFGYVALVGVVAFLMGSNDLMKDWGVGYAAWAIALGLVISNTVGTPAWAKPAVHVEYYIKTGLVLLGAEVLFGKVMAIGLPGIFLAWVVTPIVLVSTFWFGQRILKLRSRTLNITISADMCVCGVSAAVATAAACRAKKEELTLALGLSMIFTSVMMIGMPVAIHALGMPEVLGGAWIGGTIDSTGAVAVAGEFLGEKALTVAATIKMIQNILIGVIAFGVAVYFARTDEAVDKPSIGAGEIWRRFPKFILGFIGASLFFSLLHGQLAAGTATALIDEGLIRQFSKNIRAWMFCLAFVSIGLSTNFKELKQHFKGGKPLILYVCGQTLNILLTLLMAYLLFYHIFPEVTASLGD